MERGQDLIACLSDDLIQRVFSRVDFFGVIHTRAISHAVRRITSDPIYRRQYKGGSIWHITYYCDHNNHWIRASKEGDNVTLRTSIDNFRENGSPLILEPNEKIQLVLLWRCLLVFAVAGHGFLILNLWTTTAKRIRFRGVRGVTINTLRRGVRMYEDITEDGHYRLDFVNFGNGNGIATLYRYLSRRPRSCYFAFCNEVQEFSSDERNNPLRMVIKLNFPSRWVFISFRSGSGLPVSLTRPFLLDALEPLRRDIDDGRYIRLGRARSIFTHTIHGYTVQIDELGRARRISLFRVNEDFMSELVSTISPDFFTQMLWVEDRHLAVNQEFINLSLSVRNPKDGEWGYIIFQYDVRSHQWSVVKSTRGVRSAFASPTLCSSLAIMPN